MAIAVATIIFFVNLQFFLSDVRIHALLTGKDHGMNYIAASEIENKESELTLRNENPKVGNDSKNEGSMVESSLKNDTPLADHSLRKEVNPPKSSAFAEHKRADETGKAKWDRTHFILGIESGYAMTVSYTHLTLPTICSV
eukprot:TRINITY_DN8039_c0_g1_i19.p1 TRINITY_DN8039_c0_g1~~TRINITY_DN8039_c0_g1_i19.p1  ORF type:complete len:141 (-),score=37.98 TRINITY_DN8039_c0_g1_i19:47-469(-)